MVSREWVVDARDKFGFTPFHMAVIYARTVKSLFRTREWDDFQNARLQLIDYLIQMGSQYRVTERGNYLQPLVITWNYRIGGSYGGHSQSEELVRDEFLIWREELHPIYLAVWFNEQKDVERLLTGFPKTASEVTTGGDSILHFAAWQAYGIDKEMTRLILKHLLRSAVNSINHERQTPLHIATFTCNRGAVESLLRCQEILVNERNWRGYTP